MNSTPRRSLQAVILDWAGTTVDYGCMAPTAVFIETFRRYGVDITLAQARAPMGKFKKDHIREITHMEAVAAQWQTAHGQPCTEADVDALYRDFLPLQLAVIAQHAAVIPGVVETIVDFRQRDLKIGSTTGYTRAIMNALAPIAAQQGYAPDALVCADEAPAGRPFPWMCYLNQMQLGVYPGEVCVKIGDTVPDIEEGLNAGMWTIGVVKTGNEIGFTQADLAQLPLSELDERLTIGHKRLRYAGAHYTVDCLSDVPALIDAINVRLARGERPY